MIFRLLWACALALMLCACQKVSTDEAQKMVERYNQIVIEAYRRCDVSLINPVVGPNTIAGKNLTGVIGVRLDMGLSLDAELISLEVTGVEQDENELRINTRERWRYRDRRVGSGEQVGEESLDSYEILYIYKKFNNIWMVDETRFTSTPNVGRETTPWGADARTMHGIVEPQSKKKE